MKSSKGCAVLEFIFRFVFFCSIINSVVFAVVEISNGEYDFVHGEYIVSYYANVTNEEIQSHWLKASTLGVEFLDTYNSEFLKGFTGKISPQALSELQKDDIIIQAIEHNGLVKSYQADCSGLQAIAPSWGLTRISYSGNIGNGLPSRFVYDPNGGEGVTVYVIDTGIYIGHSDFGGRATWGTSFVGGNADGNGHGTFIAGLVGGDTFGISRKTDLVAVKVLDDNGSGTFANVISGVNWVVDNDKTKKLIVMALGGPGRQIALENALNNAINNNIAVVVGSGGSNANACGFSPCGLNTTICTGATTLSGTAPNIVDARAPFSSFGPCLSLFAPGVTISSTWIGSPTARQTLSGSSAATGHVAGLAATLLSQEENLTPGELKAKLVANAQQDLISNIGAGSPNRLAYNLCGNTPPPS